MLQTLRVAEDPFSACIIHVTHILFLLLLLVRRRFNMMPAEFGSLSNPFITDPRDSTACYDWSAVLVNYYTNQANFSDYF